MKRPPLPQTAEDLEALWRPHPDFIGPVGPPMLLWLHDRYKQRIWEKTVGLSREAIQAAETIEEKLNKRGRAMKKPERLGDAPIEPAYIEQMNAVAHVLDECFNGETTGKDRAVGFVLLVFPFGDTEGRCNFISNGADRKDIVILMKEMIARFTGQPETEGHA